MNSSYFKLRKAENVEKNASVEQVSAILNLGIIKNEVRVRLDLNVYLT